MLCQCENGAFESLIMHKFVRLTLFETQNAQSGTRQVRLFVFTFDTHLRCLYTYNEM